MRSADWITAAYFAYLFALAIAGPSSRSLPAGRRARAAIISACVLVAVGLSTRLPDGLIRDWVPGLFLLAGYWTPGLFYTFPDLRLEAWLARMDARLFSPERLARIAAKAPRMLLELLELSYLSCYALVPGIFAILYFSADRHLGDRFWRGVLLAEFVCYGSLPWLPSRPPRSVEKRPAGSHIDERNLLMRRLNLWLLGRVSVQANTLPSGHVAGSFVAALVAWNADPLLGFTASLVALTITLATVIGRYHYAVDAVLGMLIAGVVFLCF